jgi:aspartyl protease family protein
MLRLLLILACLILIGGGYAVRFIERALVSPAPQVAAVQDNAPRQPVHSGRRMTLESGRDGHFEVEARIEGRSIDFLVDTGASLVILRESEAARIGIRPLRSDYTATVSTANGKIKAAPAKLDRIELGGITVYDVQALVLPDGVLPRNLLGMSFLSQLKRYEFANSRLMLEQ